MWTIGTTKPEPNVHGWTETPTSGVVAKMDASNPGFHLAAGVYHLRLASGGEIAKMDVWTVEITVLDGPCSTPGEIAKRGLLVYLLRSKLLCPA